MLARDRLPAAILTLRGTLERDTDAAARASADLEAQRDALKAELQVADDGRARDLEAQLAALSRADDPLPLLIETLYEALGRAIDIEAGEESVPTLEAPDPKKEVLRAFEELEGAELGLVPLFSVRRAVLWLSRTGFDEACLALERDDLLLRLVRLNDGRNVPPDQIRDGIVCPRRGRMFFAQRLVHEPAATPPSWLSLKTATPPSWLSLKTLILEDRVPLRSRPASRPDPCRASPRGRGHRARHLRRGPLLARTGETRVR